MLKVIIVDDEMLVRIGLKTIIKWEEHGFVIAGEAGNGESALELCREVIPDIVLTDIKMPQMDGLEFYRELKKILPSVKVIILSCYDEFQYIKEALKLGAEDYILKMTMTPDDLLGIMNNVKAKIEEENVAQHEINQLRNEIKNNRQVLREKFLKELVFSNAFSNDQINQKLDNLGLDIRNHNLAIALLKVDNLQSMTSFKTERDLNLMNFAILNIVNEILSNHTYAAVFQNDRNEFVLIFSLYREVSTEKIFNSIVEVIGKIKSTIMKYLNLFVSAGVSNIHNGYEQLFCAYSEAVVSLEKRFYGHPGIIILYTEACSSKDTIDLKLLINQYPLLKAIEEKNLEQFRAYLEAITDSFRQFPCNKARQACFELLFQFGADRNNEIQKIIDKYDAYSRILEFDFLEGIKDFLCGIAGDIIAYSLSQTEKNYVVSRAKQYVRQHYNEEISLQKISTSVNVSKNYFCQLFKSETKENFITYLTRYRIEKAKELFDKTDFRTYEIAGKVGIPNTRHFSKLFMRETGMLPSEYKNKILK